MKKILFIMVGLMLISCATMKTKNEASPEFIRLYGARFIQLTSLSNYLVEYDKLAWAASDTLMKYEKSGSDGRLGAEWFVYPLGDRLVIVFGKYENGSYVPYMRYSWNDGGRLEKTSLRDAAREIRYARAINMVDEKAHEIMRDMGHKYNWYVFEDTLKGSVNVLYLPEIGQNFEIVYGGDFQFVLDKDAHEVERIDMPVSKLRYYTLNSNKTVLISDESESLPSVSSLYAIDRWKNSNNSAFLRTRKYSFELIKNEDGTFAWLTIE